MLSATRAQTNARLVTTATPHQGTFAFFRHGTAITGPTSRAMVPITGTYGASHT